MYHSIADNHGDPFSVTADAFRDQVSWLHEYGFRIVPLSFLVEGIRKRRHKALQKKVVITFDDGYKDFLTNALPILLESNTPATVFLVTDMLGGEASWNESGGRPALMSWEEVRYIRARGMNLGSHTATHANLKLLSHADREAQIKNSQERLKLLGESFYAFSYPWGQWSSQIVDAVRASGYHCAVAASGRTSLDPMNPYLLPRLPMGREINPPRFQSLSGRTSWAMKARRIFRGIRKAGWAAFSEKKPWRGDAVRNR